VAFFTTRNAVKQTIQWYCESNHAVVLGSKPKTKQVHCSPPPRSLAVYYVVITWLLLAMSMKETNHSKMKKQLWTVAFSTVVPPPATSHQPVQPDAKPTTLSVSRWRPGEVSVSHKETTFAASTAPENQGEKKHR